MGHDAGVTVTSYSVVAFNSATDSNNKIHDDDVAKRFGFRGGLVPGVDVWAYLTRPCIDRWGAEFLERGRMEGRFATPTYDGDTMVATLDDAGALELRDPAGELCASGTATLSDDAPIASFDLARTPVPDPRPDASEETLAAGTVLGTLAFGFHAAQASIYLGEVRDEHPIYEGGRVAHPGWMARQCNNVLARTVRLGPWIHVGTDARHHRRIVDGDRVEVRGVVVAEHERKGHRFVDLDVVITANDELAYSARHTAIWRPRQLA